MAEPAQQLSDVALAGLDASSIPIAIWSTQTPNRPIVYANKAFTELSGYPLEDVLGRSVTLMHGPMTDPDTLQRLRAAVEDGAAVTDVMVSHRRCGTPFANRAALAPIRNADGQVTHVLGLLADVTTELELAEQRERALAEAREERAQADEAARELAFLTELADLVSIGTLDERMSRLARLMVPQLGDRAVVEVAFDGTRPRRRSAGLPAEDPELLARAELELLDAVRPLPVEPGAIRQVTNEAGSVLGVGILAGDGRTIGTIAARRRGNRGADAFAVRVLAHLSRRAGLKLEHAWLADRQLDRSMQLQRSLLPAVPDIDGIAVAAAYAPSSRDAEIGGDWYDVLALPDGAVGLVVGDVMGHDMMAAGAMGRLSSTVRAVAWEGMPPGQTLARVSALAAWLDVAPFATCVYARLEPVAGQQLSWRLSYSSAGHPPPIVVTADGRVQLLDDADGLAIGLSPLAIQDSPTGAQEPSNGSVHLEPGSLILLYTDGAVESRTRDIDTGIAALASHLALHRDLPIDLLSKELVAATSTDGLDDDLCMLLVRLDEPAQ